MAAGIRKPVLDKDLPMLARLSGPIFSLLAASHPSAMETDGTSAMNDHMSPQSQILRSDTLRSAKIKDVCD